MASVVDYAEVLQRATSLGLSCVYHNSGSFKLPAGRVEHIVGWIGFDDPTIRGGLSATLVNVAPPYELNLSNALARAWNELLSGPAWVMPKSHWAFELQHVSEGHGNGGWMATALQAVQIDPEALRQRTDGAAIAFAKSDNGFEGFIQTLLTHLIASDFAVLFPECRHLVTVHHHKQLWWQTNDADFARKLVLLPAANGC